MKIAGTGRSFISLGWVALVLLASACPLQKKPKTAADAPPPEVARVDGRSLRADALDAHMQSTHLGRPEALEDLIDVDLLRAAAAKASLPLPPGEWTEEQRANADYDVAKALGIELPAAPEVVVVDHAWVKNAKKKRQLAADRATIDKIRVAVVGGAKIPDAWKELGVTGDAWHIGDHEEYAYDVVPAEARDLPPGTISPVIPGNGGLHLFQIYAKKRTLPPGDKTRAALHEKLRKEAKIERVP